MTDHPDDIPAFLRLTAEQRRAGWERNPPKPWPKGSFGRERTETERLYYASLERDKARKRAEDEARFKELRDKAAADKAERDAVAAAVRKRNMTKTDT